MELILDASSTTVSTALAKDGALIWSGQWLSQNDHTRRLMPELMQGLEATSTAPRDVTAIIVALGPGPFNGLRVAVAAAKGFAIGTGATIYGIGTLEAEAARCSPDVLEVRPVLRVGKSGFVTALYARDGFEWHMQDDIQVLDEDALAELPIGGSALCGELEPDHVERLTRAMGNRIRVHNPEMTRTESLLRLGYARIAAGGFTPVALVQPVYARPPHITQPRDRRT
ncbi:MAG: tRNA (adenosine(37)-N6)-threonylcarbamoyltransferase complex dimerization subunit type 1 TsaB [Chloroflexota bacterium]